MIEVADATGMAWYAVTVRSRHEKMVSKQMRDLAIDHYLPVVERRKKWSDRYKLVCEPLFPGYVFVRIGLDERIRVLEVRGIARLIGFNSKPHPIPDEQIEGVRTAVESKLKVDPYPHLQPGVEVEVRKGPLKGYRGVLIEKDRKHRLLISVHLIGQAVAVEINAGDVEAV